MDIDSLLFFLGCIAGSTILFFILFLTGALILLPDVESQKACGSDTAIHIFNKYDKKLAICERPGGLVVVEVK